MGASRAVPGVPGVAAADDVGGTGGTVVVLGLSPYQARELVFWALLPGVLVWAAVRAVRWFVLRYARHTRWGRRTRTRQGLRRARGGLLERYARGEITEDECRERLRILGDEGRAGP